VTTSLYRRGPDAWKLRYSNVPEKLKLLHNQGYKLVVFCNDSMIGKTVSQDTRQRAIEEQTARIVGLLHRLDLPLNFFVATAPPKITDDPYRKPATGMWDYLIQHCNNSISPNMSQCFFVGGSAGRPKTNYKTADHSDYDLRFAENTGLKFYTDDEYFGVTSKQTASVIAAEAKKSAEKKHDESNSTVESKDKQSNKTVNI